MLRRMRAALFIKIVMGILVVAFIGTIFLVWGKGSVPGTGGTAGVVATVGGEEITYDEYLRAYRRQLQIYQQLLGDNFDEKALAALNLKERVLDRLIDQRLTIRQARAMSLAVSAEELATEIRTLPAFSAAGGFTKERYLRLLASLRMTPERFEEEFRQEVLGRKVEEMVKEAVKVSEREVEQALRAARQRLTVELVQLPAEKAKEKADQVALALGQGKSLAAAAGEAGLAVRVAGPFPAEAPPRDLPDPNAVLRAALSLRKGETSPLVQGPAGGFIVRLVDRQEVEPEELLRDREAFGRRYLLQKREEVFADWLSQVRRGEKIWIDREGL